MPPAHTRMDTLETPSITISQPTANDTVLNTNHKKLSLLATYRYSEEQTITMYSDVEEFIEAGTYKLFVFCDKQMIGQTSFTLK